jgi:hypothetical protein
MPSMPCERKASLVMAEKKTFSTVSAQVHFGTYRATRELAFQNLCLVMAAALQLNKAFMRERRRCLSCVAESAICASSRDL